LYIRATTSGWSLSARRPRRSTPWGSSEASVVYKRQLVDYLNSTSSGVRGPFFVSQKTADVKFRNAVRLVLSSPEYQFN